MYQLEKYGHKPVNPFYGFCHIIALHNKAVQKWSKR